MKRSKSILRYLLAVVIGAGILSAALLIVLDNGPGLKVGSYWTRSGVTEVDPSAILARHLNWNTLGVLLFLWMIRSAVSLFLPRRASVRAAGAGSSFLSVFVYVFLVIGFILVFQRRALIGGVVLAVISLRRFRGGSVRSRLELSAALGALGLLGLGLFGMFFPGSVPVSPEVWVAFDILIGLGVGIELSSIVYALEEVR